MKQEDNIKLLVIVVGVYIAIQMLADILSLRILLIAGMSVDGGTLVYPLAFTIRDLLHRLAGKAVARTVVVLAAGINIFMVFMFWLVSVLPPDMTIGMQDSFGQVLVPFWRIVFASIIAEVISGILDGEVYEKWQNRFGKEKVWGRVLSSNAVSIPVDSFAFSFLAFYGQMPLEIVVSIFVSNMVIKFIVGSLSLPIIYATKN